MNVARQQNIDERRQLRDRAACVTNARNTIDNTLRCERRQTTLLEDMAQKEPDFILPYRQAVLTITKPAPASPS